MSLSVFLRWALVNGFRQRRNSASTTCKDAIGEEEEEEEEEEDAVEEDCNDKTEVKRYDQIPLRLK